MSRSQNLEPVGTAGFTLVEALVALGVMAAGLAAIGALANSNLRVSLYTERHLAEIETARKVITGMPARNELPFGNLAGVLDAHQWRIESTALSTPLAGAGASWVPQGIALLVRSPSGATIEVDTIRLRKRATK
ncbi:MAG: type II secretion system protein [Hyphomicrobiales bacterium]|nr:type II secretion system protein [Hyphomicrobiales bacterium]